MSYLCGKMIKLSGIKPYTNQEDSKKTQVRNMFDKIAPVYDLMNSVLSLGIDQYWRKKAIQQLPNTKNRSLQILDVATGTADMAIQTLKSNPEYQITGIDLSEGMLAIGRKRLSKLGLSSQITLEQADCENLNFQDNLFDGIMAAFGVRNFENLDLGLGQMYRVLKPKGKIVILEFSKPQYFPFKQIFNFYFKNLLPLIGRFGSKDKNAYKYLYESVQQFPDYERFLDKLRKTGFTECKFQSLSLGVCSIYTGIK